MRQTGCKPGQKRGTMRDLNGNEIEVRGDFIIVRVSIKSSEKAMKHSKNGKVTLTSDSYYESAKQANSYIREADPAVKFGVDEVSGEASVVISLKEIRHLAFAAARNKSKKSQLGPARAAFSGIRTFTAE